MPANIVTINGVSEFNVVDSKMTEFLEWLEKNGFPQNKEAEEILKEVE